MADEVFEARLLPRRKDGDVEVFRMKVLDSSGEPIDLASGGAGVSQLSVLSKEQLQVEILDGEKRVIGEIPVTFYGAPGDGSIFLWSDGGLGILRTTKITTINFVDFLDGFSVTHRAHILTPNDRTVWVARSDSFQPLADLVASALVTRVPEIRLQNVVRNAYIPSDAELTAFRIQLAEANDPQNPYLQFVTGRPGITNPTTDELIQWASHKWGIPTNWVRSQMHLESQWSMDFLGDLTTQPDETHYLAAPEYSRVSSTLNVYESLGISQLRWFPDKAGNLNPHPGTDPLRWLSTAFNLDVYGATVRAYFDDPEGWRTAWGDGSYSPGNEWLSIGGWFLPYPWNNSGQQNYIASVQERLATSPWTIADFSNDPESIVVVRQPNIVRSQYGPILERPRPIVEVYIPPTVPDAPVDVTIEPGDTTLTLAWTPPVNNGGTPLTGYRITEVNEGWTVDTGSAIDVNPFTLTGLTNGHSQTFTIAAINLVGASAESAPVTASPISPTPPGAPTGVSGTPGDEIVHLTWTAPSSNGGSAITGYRITPYIAGVAQTPVTTSSPVTMYTVTGLANDISYTFTVSAVNASVGVGDESTQTSAITPVGRELPASMPIISRGLPAYSPTQPGGTSSNLLPDKAVDSIKGTRFNSLTNPTGASPHQFILDLRTVPSADKSQSVVIVENMSSPGKVNIGATPVWYSAPKHVVLYTHTSSGSMPAANDAGWAKVDEWQDLNTVTAIRLGPSDNGFNFSAANWVRFEFLSSWLNDSVGVDIEIRDGREAMDDMLLVYGDSWVHEGMHEQDVTNNPFRFGAIQDIVEQLDPTRPAPVIERAGTGGWTIIGGSTEEYLDSFIGNSKCPYVVLALGANDVNGWGVNLNTIGGAASAQIANIRNAFRTAIDYILDLDKIPVLPHVNFQTLQPFSDPNSILVNAVIDELLIEYPTAILGPEIYEFFKAHPELLRVNPPNDINLHPSTDIEDEAHLYQGKTGQEWYHQLWAEWLVTEFHGGTLPSIPGVPTDVVASAADMAANLTWGAPAGPVNGYVITPFIGASPQSPIYTNSSSTSFTVTGLTNSSTYTFRVAAINSAGTGTNSNSSNTVTPASSGPSELLFSDDFETGTLSKWNSPEILAGGAGTTIVNTTDSAQEGTRGLKLTTDTGGSCLLRHVDSSWDSEDTLISFQWRPISVVNPSVIVWARDSEGGRNVWLLSYEPATHSLRLDGFNGGGGAAVAQIASPNNSVTEDQWHSIDIRFRANSNGLMRLSINGVQSGTTNGDYSRAVDAGPLTVLQLWLDTPNSEWHFDDVTVLG